MGAFPSRAHEAAQVRDREFAESSLVCAEWAVYAQGRSQPVAASRVGEFEGVASFDECAHEARCGAAMYVELDRDLLDA